MQIDVGDLTGINTGYSDLKRITSGLQAGNLIIVGVHPEMGKRHLYGTLPIMQRVQIQQLESYDKANVTMREIYAKTRN